MFVVLPDTLIYYNEPRIFYCILVSSPFLFCFLLSLGAGRGIRIMAKLIGLTVLSMLDSIFKQEASSNAYITVMTLILNLGNY